jgi:uncharacterized repeat protein (TIGR02543 family)
MQRGKKHMRSNNRKKVIASITTIAFICAAFIPTVHSQIGKASLLQELQNATIENTVQVTITNLLNKYEETIIKTSPQNSPLPLSDDPPNVHLPTSQVTMTVFSGTTSYFRTLLSNVPAGYEVSNGNYTGWCSDSAHTINLNTPYQVTLYSSYNTSLPSYLYHQNWSKVNYILNHKVGTDWHQVEYAMLYILNFGNQGLTTNGWTMVNEAIAYGGSYIPGGGDIIAIIADTGPTVQRTIFELTVPTYTLSISINGQGSVEEDPDQPLYTYSQIVQLNAIPDLGWSFNQWGGDLSGSTNPTTISMTGNKAVTATFTQCIYTLSISVDPVAGGSVGVVPSPPYYYGTVVTLTASVNPGYTFGYWSGDASGTNPVTTVTMTGDKSVTAHFTQNGYTLTIIIDGQGTVIKDPEQNTYAYNSIVELTAIADENWVFNSWSGDISGNENPQNITMNANKTVTAHFTYTGDDTIPPVVKIVKPIDNGIYIFNKLILSLKTIQMPIIVQMVTIEVNASDNESGIDHVEFFIDGVSKSTDASAPYSYDWREIQSGKHTITVKAYDNAGNNATSPDLRVFKWRFHPMLVVLLLLLGLVWQNEKPTTTTTTT